MRQEEEERHKQEKKVNAKNQLKQWQSDRQKQTEQRKKQNKEDEVQYYEEKKRLKDTTNPWERVVSNVEINAAQYVGGADVARMRQAMIARKADITKGGASFKQTM